jgi:hypothetical protein
MKGRWRVQTALLVVVLAFLAGSVAFAQAGSGRASLLATVPSTGLTTGYDLAWHTVDSGGDTFSTGGDYSLGGTLGQPDAGLMEGEDYVLGGGFWGGGAVASAKYRIYLPLIQRDT